MALDEMGFVFFVVVVLTHLYLKFAGKWKRTTRKRCTVLEATVGPFPLGVQSFTGGKYTHKAFVLSPAVDSDFPLNSWESALDLASFL